MYSPGFYSVLRSLYYVLGKCEIFVLRLCVFLNISIHSTVAVNKNCNIWQVEQPNASTKSFTFNVTFEPDATQEDVFENSGVKKLVDMAIEGFVINAIVVVADVHRLKLVAHSEIKLKQNIETASNSVLGLFQPHLHTWTCELNMLMRLKHNKPITVSGCFSVLFQLYFRMCNGLNVLSHCMLHGDRICTHFTGEGVWSTLPSLCQKMSDLVEVWCSYNKNNFVCFLLRHDVDVYLKVDQTPSPVKWVEIRSLGRQCEQTRWYVVRTRPRLKPGVNRYILAT